MTPRPEFAQTLEDHLESVGEDKKVRRRLEICYLLYYPLSKACNDDFWE